MSVQFGIWRFGGPPLTAGHLDRVSAILAPFGPDSDQRYSQKSVNIIYRGFHTTNDSRQEIQPHVTQDGLVITWDGRLDNRSELIGELRDYLSDSYTDVAIVAATYEKWGVKAFSRLHGDWSLSIWDPHNQTLKLVKDPVGAHHLYYSIDNNHAIWSTLLDPIMLLAEKTLIPSEEYLAGWLS